MYTKCIESNVKEIFLQYNKIILKVLFYYDYEIMILLAVYLQQYV